MLNRLLSRFFVDFFVSQYRKNLQGNPSVLCFRKFLITNRFMDKNGRGSVDNFRRKKFVSQCRNISQRNPSVLCFRKILIGYRFMDKRVGGSAKMFRRNFFVSQC